MNRQGLFAYVRTWKSRLVTTTKYMVVVTSLFNLVISSFPDNMFYHAWTTLLIYHDGSNDVVQVCSFIKPWTVCSNHWQTCQQHCSSWPAQSCSSWPAQVQACQQPKTSCAFLCVYKKTLHCNLQQVYKSIFNSMSTCTLTPREHLNVSRSNLWTLERISKNW